MSYLSFRLHNFQRPLPISGLTPKQIQAKMALSVLPDHISNFVYRELFGEKSKKNNHFTSNNNCDIICDIVWAYKNIREGGYVRIQRAARIALELGGEALNNEALAALFLLKVSDLTDFQENIKKSALALQKAKQYKPETLSLNCGMNEYISAIEKTLFLEKSLSLLPAHLAIEQSYLEREIENGTLDENRLNQVVLGLAPLSEKYGLIAFAESFRSLVLKGFLSSGELKQIEGIRWFGACSRPDTGVEMEEPGDFERKLETIGTKIYDTAKKEQIMGIYFIAGRIKSAYRIWETARIMGFDFKFRDIFGINIGLDIDERYKSHPQKLVEAIMRKDLFHSKEILTIDELDAASAADRPFKKVLQLNYCGSWKVLVKIASLDVFEKMNSQRRANWEAKTALSLRVLGIK